MSVYCKKKSTPVNKNLYNRLKQKIKARSKVWPSAYASGQLVRAYKSKGGKYKCSFGSLDRWFKEKWVNVCKPKGSGYAVCGRSKSSRKGYPYCRPLKRINSQTPKTVGEIGKAKIKKMCSTKRKNPYRRIFLKFGEKRNVDENYKNMEKSCGFGRRRRQRFGEFLPIENSNYTTFFQPGTDNSSHLTNGVRNCESVMYGDSILNSNYRFGKKKLKNKELTKINKDILYLTKL